MKTIRNNIYVLLAAMILFVVACNKDNLSAEEGDPATIMLSLNNMQLRGGELVTGDTKITTIRIYVFNGNYLDAMRVYTSGEDDFQNPFRIQTTTGPKTVYVIANEPAEMYDKLNGVTTPNTLKSLVTPETTGPLAAPLTMVGQSDPVDVQYVADPASYTQVTVNLTRLATRINLKVRKDESTTAEIIMRAVHIKRAPAKSALTEGEDVGGQEYWNHMYEGKGHVPLITTGVDAWTSGTPMYIYENPGSATDTAGRATYIMIDATYDGVDTRYKAYINDETATSSDNQFVPHPYALRRNHEYNLVATINNIGEFDGLTLRTYVNQWNLWSSQLIFERTFEMNPRPTAENNTYTVMSETDAVTFTFKLTNPMGAKWKAQLSDIYNFELSILTEGGEVSEGDMGTEYTISVKPRNPQAATERSTEFYITVGNQNTGLPYAEIPLIEGSSLIGEGNRVVITQPAVTAP